MASTLQITDGTTTIDLISASAAGLRDYQIIGARASETSTDEQVNVNFLSYSTGRTTVNSINTIFARARQRALTSTGPRCFVQMAIEGEGTTWRSEITDGFVTPGDATLGSDPASNNLYVTVGWTRMPYWEGARTQIAISNQSASNNTSGLTINSHTVSGSASAYCTIASSVITGDVPTPVEVQLTNTTGSALGYCMYGLMLGTTGWTTPAFLQGESATYTGGSNVGGSGSGNSYKSAPISAGSNYMDWTVTDSMLSLSDGKSAVPVVAHISVPPACYLSGYLGGLTTDYASTNTSRLWTVLPPMMLPPARNGGPYASHTFEITIYLPSGSGTITVDYVHFIPCTDGWREIVAAANGSNTIANGDILVDDNIEGYTYSSSSGNRNSAYDAHGTPPMLIPGQAATLNFFLGTVSAAGGSVSTSNTVTAKLYYRPRRRSI